MNLASKMNKKCNVFQKLKSLFLHSCGLTNTGMTAMNKLGETLSCRSLLDVRTDLAIKDEEFMMSLARDHHLAYVIDNLDIEHNKVLEHKTLPIILCRKVSDSVESYYDTRKSLDENLAFFDLDFFCLDSPQNIEEKNAFLDVLFTVLATIMKDSPNFEFLSKIFLSHILTRIKEKLKRKSKNISSLL